MILGGFGEGNLGEVFIRFLLILLVQQLLPSSATRLEVLLYWHCLQAEELNGSTLICCWKGCTWIHHPRCCSRLIHWDWSSSNSLNKRDGSVTFRSAHC